MPTTPTDDLYSLQWHFDLIGDVETIWDDYDGTGVVTAVYDDGVDYTHADLNDNYNSSLEFSYDANRDGFDEVFDPFPIGFSDAHGTAVAGIIAGEMNNSGIVGIAHGSQVTGVNLLEDIQNGDGIGGFDAFDIAFIRAAIAHAQNFDIMSNSWGRSPYYGDFQSADDLLEIAVYEDISENGRDGLGTIIVQAGGNETSNVNGDGLNASRHTITVAATEQDGSIADYSNWGAGVLVAAPAASVTTDLQDDRGYNGSFDFDTVDPDYTSEFGGTSAATPVVSGVAALMLEANPDLGWRDVQNILAVTASQTGSDLGAAASGHERADWVISEGDGGASWNGGGLSYHINYGFGMVDAFAAVRMAEVWLDMNGPAQTSANEQHITYDYSGPGIALADSNTIGTYEYTYSDFEISDDISIETVVVTVTLDHSYGSDLSIGLIAPDGTIVPLFFNETGLVYDPVLDDYDFDSSFMDGGWTWSFEVSGLLGYSSQGTWQIVVGDDYPGDIGVLEDYQVDFYGATSTNNDIHIISVDFLEVVEYDTNRSVIADTNGGTDWLNFVGVNSDGVGNSDLIAGMSNGSTFSVDGENWGSLGSDFENLVSGDGNDTISGNAQNNTIMGMRGDDQIDGGAGDDTVLGGQGNDTLTTLSGNDTLDGEDGNDQFNIGFDTVTAEIKTVRGGNQRDTIQFSGLTSSLTVLGSYALANEGADRINFEGIEVLYTSHFDDTVTITTIEELHTLGGADTVEIRSGFANINLGNGDDTATVINGAEFNVVDGGSGVDTVDMSNFAIADVTVYARDSGIELEVFDDFLNPSSNTFSNFEFFEFSDGTVTAQELLANSTNLNTLIGTDGNDVLDGSASDQEVIILAGDGDDTITGSALDDDLFGQAGDDTIVDGLGDTEAGGGDGHDYVVALSGLNTLNGDSGNDVLIGGIAGDTLDGGTGNDILIGDPAALSFGASDQLTGGAGNDLLHGGIGADEFIFAVNDGNDTIGSVDMNSITFSAANGYQGSVTGADFTIGVDTIVLSGFGTVNSGNVMDFVTNSADGAVFNAEGTNILIYGVSVADLGSDDFVFV